MRNIFRALYATFYILVGYLAMAVYGLFFTRVYGWLIRDKKRAVYIAAKNWGSLLLRMSGIKLEVSDPNQLAPGRNYIFASNHASLIDLWIICAAVPIHFLYVMDEELFNIPIFGAWCRYAGYLPVSRRHPRRALKQLADIDEKIKAGNSVVIFPEGGRSHDGNISPFKSGLGRMVNETGVPVIPLAIIGSFTLLPKGSFIIHPNRVRVNFGKVMEFAAGLRDSDISARVQRQVETLFNAV